MLEKPIVFEFKELKVENMASNLKPFKRITSTLNKSKPNNLVITVIQSLHQHTDIDPNIRVNSLKIEKQEYVVRNAQRSVRKPIPLPKHVNRKIPIEIAKATNGETIIQILTDNKPAINHCGIYGKAMQKCGMLKDWDSLHEIFKLLLSHPNIKPDLLSFNIFLNNMALSTNPSYECIKYLAVMLNEYQIKPDVITFSAIIKCLRLRAEYKEAGKCWKIMTQKYGLKPENNLYCEMISVYSIQHQIESATDIFNDWLHRVNTGELQPVIVVFNAYLNGFSRIGDMDGMQKVMKLITEYGLELDHNAMADIMRGCLRMNDHKACLKAFQQCIDSGYRPNMSMMALKCVALTRCIKDTDDYNEKQNIYMRLVDTLNNQLTFYGLKMVSRLAGTQLDAAINLYENEPLKVVEVFESLVERGLIGYQNCKGDIDLHMFSLTQARFILRYLFGFRLNELMKDDMDELIIVTGKGIHTPGDKGKDGMNGRMRQFVITELESWSPFISCRICKENKGTVAIKRDSLLPYLNTQMKFDMVLK